MLDDITASSLEKLYDFLYVVVVFLLGYASDAAALAPFDVIVQAWAELSTQNCI
jgi:hypothetical protein